MKLKSRNFPHPVLDPVSDDITKSYFTGNILNYEDDNGLLRFSIEFKLKNDTLNTLFLEKKVHLNIHFECSSTMQRISHQIAFLDCFVTQNKDEFIYNTDITVDSVFLNKKVYVNYFILSNQELVDYTNSNMHQDFQTTKFRIEKGDILAFAVTQTIHIEKEEIVPPTSSIIKIAKNPSANAEPISVALNNSQIEVILPNTVYEQIGRLKSDVSSDLNKILYSMIYYPTLIDVLHTIQSVETGDLETYESLDWYRTLEKKIRSMNLNITNLNSEIITSLSYKLLYESVDEPWTALEAVLYREDSEYEESNE